MDGARNVAEVGPEICPIRCRVRALHGLTGLDDLERHSWYDAGPGASVSPSDLDPFFHLSLPRTPHAGPVPRLESVCSVRGEDGQCLASERVERRRQCGLVRL